jgi:hypothetical protein
MSCDITESGRVALTSSFAAGADGFSKFAPGQMCLAGCVNGLGQFLLRGGTAERGELNRHERRKRCVEIIRFWVLVLNRVGQAVGVGDEIGKRGSHQNHSRYLSRAGRIAWTMASSPPHHTDSTSSLPLVSGPMNMTMSSSCRTWWIANRRACSMSSSLTP